MDTPWAIEGGLFPGRVIDRYVVEERLGAGGMATVYRVRHQQLGGTYALKVLASGAPALRARLLAEGRAQSALRHPNLVAVHDVVDVDGSPGLIMAYVDGPTLAALIERGRLSIGRADRLARDVIRGVAAAHREGVVHRDLKPANVLLALTDDGPVAKVADFGLARLLGGSDADHGLTRPGMALGTPAYMAPEQLRDASAVDARADIFALGALLYELLTGERAFQGRDTLDLYTRIAAGTRRPVHELRPDVPARMEAAIDGALQPDPAARFADCEQLLRTWIGDVSVAEAEPWDVSELRSAAIERRIARGGSSTFDVAALPAEPSRVETRAAPTWWPWVALAAVALGAVAVTWRPAPPPHRTPSIARLTHEVGSERHPTLTPDGSAVAYSDGTDLWLRRPGTDVAENLTADFAPAASHPAFSPDGLRLAFTGDGALYVSGPRGESPRRVAEVGYMPAWSPDGRRIAVGTEDFDDSTSRATYDCQPHVVDLATGAVSALEAGQDAAQATWSPSGTWLAFDGLKLVHTAGGPVVRTGQSVWSPVWTPDGAIWSVRTRGEAMEIVRQPWDERSGEPAGPQEVVVPLSMGEIRSLAVTADGARLAVDAVAVAAQIHRLELDPATWTARGPARPVTTGNLVVGGPALSPDGTRLAWVSEDAAEDLFVGNADGSEPRRLSTGQEYTRGTGWSPDGRRIVFYGRRNGNYGIYEVDADGGDLRWLSEDLGHTDLWLPRYSPDGRRLAFSMADRQPMIVELGRPWAPQVAARTRPENVGWIATGWSPDGRWLAVSDAQGHLGRMNADTFEIEPLADEGYYPQFTPDGGHLVVGVDSRIFVLDLATRATRDLSSFAPARLPATPSMWLSADGTALYFAALTEDADIWLVDR